MRHRIPDLVPPVAFALLSCAALALVAGLRPSAPQSSATHGVPDTRAASAKLYATPLAFEPNQGQTQAWVDYLARGPGYTLALDGGDAMLRLEGAADYLKLDLLGQPAPAVAEHAQPGKSHYFSGNDPAQWQRDVSHYARVRYTAVWPGVDVAYYGNTQQQLEYDFVVAPGASVDAIALRFEGAEKQTLDADGNLRLALGAQEIVQHKPVSYQVKDGARVEVDSAYAIREDGSVGIEVAAYDDSLTLTIDPVLVYGTYLGGSSNFEAIVDVAVAGDRAFVTGYTRSADFPVTAGVFDPSIGATQQAFVSRFSADGSTLDWSTYLGHEANTTNLAQAIRVHPVTGDVYVAGTTDAGPAFPTTAGAFMTCRAGLADLFVTKLTSDGSGLVYSTCFGGNTSTFLAGLALDGAGIAHIAGFTGNGGTIPTTLGAFDVTPNGGLDMFITKLSGDGSALTYSTYVGGSDHEITKAPDPTAHQLAVDDQGSAYLVGITASTDLPTNFQGASSGRNAFVFKLSADGSTRLYSTYLGGTGSEDHNTAIAVGPSRQAVVMFRTASTNALTTLAPDTTGDSNGDIFIARLNTTGTGYGGTATYLGGDSIDEPFALALGTDETVHVAGSSNCFSSIPATPGALMQEGSAFVAQYSADGQRISYTSCLGSGVPNALAVGSDGAVYVVGAAFASGPPIRPVPTTAGAFDTTFANSTDTDGFLMKLLPLRDSVARFSFASYTVAENLGPASITVQRSNSSAGTFQVDYAVTAGSADASDATLVTGTLNWADGDNSNKSFSVPFNNDAVAEGNETLNLTLTQPNGRLGTQSSAVLTIDNDDGVAPPPGSSLAFESATSSLREGLTSNVSIFRSGDTSLAASVTVSANDGSAFEGTDYSFPAPVTANFAVGATRADVSLPVTRDELEDAGETLTLVLSNPSNATLAGPSTVVVTIEDEPVVRFAPASYSINEGSIGTFTLTRSGTAVSRLEVSVRSVNGSASAPGDFAATDNVVTFVEGSQTVSFNLPTSDDSVAEGNESFTLQAAIFCPDGCPFAQVAGGPATVTITDNDGVPPPPPAPDDQTTTGSSGGGAGGWALLLPLLAAALRQALLKKNFRRLHSRMALRRRAAATAVVALGLSAGAAQAWPDYLEVHGGAASPGVGDAQLSRSLQARGHAVQATSEGDTAYGFSAGYRLRSHFSLELGLNHNGDFAIGLQGAVSDRARLLQDVHHEGPHASGTLLTAGGRLHFPLASKLSFDPGFGLFLGRRTTELRFADGQTLSTESSSKGFSVQPRLSWALTPALSAGLQSGLWVADSHSAVVVWGATLRWMPRGR